MCAGLSVKAAYKRPLWAGGHITVINTGLEKKLKNHDIYNMNDFTRGMNTVGQLFPAPASYDGYPASSQAWKDVAKSFFHAGQNLCSAIKETAHAQPKGQQTH